MSDASDASRNDRWLRSAVIVFLVAATCLRGVFFFFWDHDLRGPSAEQIGAVLENPVDRSVDGEPVTVTALVFDPTAQVILGYGADGQPGRARFDDNFDRQIDNELELGAIGSDDLCVAPWQSAYDATRQQAGTRVISVGEYVTDKSQDTPVDSPTRWLVSGYDWTWLVVR